MIPLTPAALELATLSSSGTPRSFTGYIHPACTGPPLARPAPRPLPTSEPNPITTRERAMSDGANDSTSRKYGSIYEKNTNPPPKPKIVML